MRKMIFKKVIFLTVCIILFGMIFLFSAPSFTKAAVNTKHPSKTVRLTFIHHSVGENWLSDSNGRLGIALRNNNYFVSDTNYGWGPSAIGDKTDIGQWWLWFRGPSKSTYMNALYNMSDQNSSYSRLAHNPGGENEIIMFKSCFPNSALKGSAGASIPSISNNHLKGQNSSSPYHKVANAKGIYKDLLKYFKTRQDKLFIVITASPLSSGVYASNARAFNNWLVNDWLDGYPYKNVFVFDFYNVLTSNGGNANTNDLGRSSGNHHRVRNGAVQHKTSSSNRLKYPTGDDHPSKAGNLKATGEFLPLLNYAYNRWKNSSTVSSHPSGTLVQSSSGSAVYLIEGSRKRPISSSYIFESRFGSWNKIVTVSSSELRHYSNGSAVPFRDGELVKEQNRPTIYVFQGGKKRPIPSERIFLSYGYKWENIITVPDGTLNRFSSSSALSRYTRTHPSGTIIKSNSGSTIYYISGRTKRPIRNSYVFDSNFPNSWNKIITVSNSELGRYSNSSALPYRDGELVKERSHSTIYVFEYGRKRPIPSARVFTAYGYSWNNIIAAPVGSLARYRRGAALNI